MKSMDDKSIAINIEKHIVVQCYISLYLYSYIYIYSYIFCTSPLIHFGAASSLIPISLPLLGKVPANGVAIFL